MRVFVSRCNARAYFASMYIYIYILKSSELGLKYLQIFSNTFVNILDLYFEHIFKMILKANLMQIFKLNLNLFSIYIMLKYMIKSIHKK